jgi:hypothetical protein
MAAAFLHVQSCCQRASNLAEGRWTRLIVIKNRRKSQRHSISDSKGIHACADNEKGKWRLKEAGQGMMIPPNQSAVNGLWSGDLATMGLACTERYCGRCAILRILPEGAIPEENIETDKHDMGMVRGSLGYS